MPQSKYRFHFHIAREETKAQRHYIICPGSQSQSLDSHSTDMVIWFHKPTGTTKESEGSLQKWRQTPDLPNQCGLARAAWGQSHRKENWPVPALCCMVYRACFVLFHLTLSQQTEFISIRYPLFKTKDVCNVIEEESLTVLRTCCFDRGENVIRYSGLNLAKQYNTGAGYNKSDMYTVMPLFVDGQNLFGISML